VPVASQDSKRSYIWVLGVSTVASQDSKRSYIWV